MPPRKKPATPKPIEATKHKNKRRNIPTEELRDFVKKDEDTPGTLLYPRDPSLDPQLVWKGKDEQDREDLTVPVVPVYIQEKVQPRAIIENVRAEAKKGAPSQLGLFADFNGIAFEELIEFYQHEQNWSNRMVLGDSLMVMASLAEKEGLKGKVQMIYIDPPYGIKFGSNWQVSTRKRDVRDGRAARVRNAGGIFVGETSPETLGDYTAGPSHVMPTMGTARFASPLGVQDFLKASSVVAVDETVLRALGPATARIARAEGWLGVGACPRATCPPEAEAKDPQHRVAPPRRRASVGTRGTSAWPRASPAPRAGWGWEPVLERP